MTLMGGGITHHTTVQLTSLLMMLQSMMQQEGLSGHSVMHSVSVYMGLSSAMFPAVRVAQRRLWFQLEVMIALMSWLE
jgi:hypothetical protein